MNKQKLSIKEIPKIEKTIFEKMYFYFFLILPFIYFDKLVDPVLIPRQIFLIIFNLIVGIIICYHISIKKLKGDFMFLKSPLFFIMIIFITTIVISFYQSIVLSESIYTFSKIISECVFLVLTTFLIISKQLNIQSLIKSIIVFSIITVLIALFQSLKIYLTEDDFFGKVNQITSTNANKNLLSSILFLTTPFVIYSLGLSKLWRKISIILMSIILIFFWVLQTKAVIIAFILFIITSFFFFYNRKSFRIYNNKITTFSVLIFLSLITIISFKNKEKFPNFFNGNTIQTRVLLWDNTSEMIKNHFLFGVGAGNWQINFPKYGLDKFKTSEMTSGMTTYQRPHNDFLWILSELGILGFVLYILMFIILLFYTYKLIKKHSEKKESSLYILLFSVIIGYLVIAFSDFPLERIEHQIILFTIFSIIISQYYLSFNNLDNIKKVNIKVLPFLIAIACSFVFEIIVLSNRYKGELHTSLMFAAHKTNNWQEMINEADQANNFYYTIDPMSTPLNWYKGVALFTTDKISEAKIEFEKALKIHPYNIHVINNLGSCHEKLGDHKMAENNYKKALQISSHFEEVLLNLSAVYFNTNEFKRAFETIDKCDTNSLDPKYKIFLTPILNSRINSILVKTQNIKIKDKLNVLKNNNEKLISLYFESKKKNISFDNYLFNHI